MKLFSALSFLIITSLFILSGCKDESKSAAYAQCHIDSHSDTGINFEKKFIPTDEKDKDAPYRNWMLLCMESKGYQFYAPNEKAKCWNGMVSNVLDQSCYH